jgi:hypothetical protein
MLIAICISGFLRTWEFTKKSFMEQFLKDKNNTYHIFIHTYVQNLYEFTANKEDVILDLDEIKKLFEGLDLKILTIEDRDKILPSIYKKADKYKHISNFNLQQKESSDAKSISIPIGVRTFDHLRKLHLCNENRKIFEKENNIKYDLVVKTRFDLLYFNSPNWSECLDNKLHFDYGSTFGFPNDTLAIVKPEIMDNFYANRFLYLDEMLIKGPNLIDGICAHASLKWIIEKGKIEIGIPVVNTNCFRSEKSLQFYGDYHCRADIHWLYKTIVDSGLTDIYEIENLKCTLLRK